ncbi:DNA primase DnaG [Halodesulfurarchaeum sp. HSR-GB]|uniref:DNA primase DnaG n=1 Tax=Halodesulfurarchaeum sp. HSR-GB TaxID=3074077 RepID=UPI0028616883|nr:DNA primase DnaG [Halodesulfurarchaeum sp. HSR-GB]MDR5655780.1 DNA primase DnaG [Halodesulfurarchaeum sp. HSR-GB]
MEDTAKYLIHAGFVADGVIERSDVVGAVFGQTEGLLGDELELRDLQESSKLGRIDVEVQSEGGKSRGTITIASSLDRVETATLAAALEAIDRIGPSQATVEIDRIEDVRAAKRREVVERAKELLATAFDEQVMDSRAILEEVRESIRVGDIIEYEGLPAGPNVAESDAVIVVEGRADVRTLLRYGIKNAIAVEGTDVPEAVAALTREKTATAFLDGDRGGDLIREELMQVGDLDYVALSPPGRSVEDLSRHEVHTALQEKVPVEALERERSTESDSATASQPGSSATDGGGGAVAVTTETASPQPAETTDSEPDSESAAATLAGQIEAVSGSESARVLDAEFRLLESGDLDTARSLVRAAGDGARTVLVDGPVAQPLLDVAAKHGVTAIYGTGEGDIVKQPASVRIRSLEAT